MSSTLSKQALERLYLVEKKSVSDIAGGLGCSQNKINYWIKKYEIPKRSVSEAIYAKRNPKGDPFSTKRVKPKNQFLYGLGLGLYWGEGTKSNKHCVRLGNTDPDLVKKFIEFLEVIYEIDRDKLKFGLQVFSDMDPAEAQKYWMRKLKMKKSQFYPKIVVTPERGVGNYRKKTKYGVLTVHFSNVKLRNIVCEAIDNIR